MSLHPAADLTDFAEDFRSLGRPFRGEIWENAERFRLLGKAYEAMPAAQEGYFDWPQRK